MIEKIPMGVSWYVFYRLTDHQTPEDMVMVIGDCPNWQDAKAYWEAKPGVAMVTHIRRRVEMKWKHSRNEIVHDVRDPVQIEAEKNLRAVPVDPLQGKTSALAALRHAPKA